MLTTPLTNPVRVLGAAAAMLAGTLGAQSPIHLAGPDVAKLDWNTRSMVAADFNNDGRLDLGVIDNDSGKIELLLQRDGTGKKQASRRVLTRNRWEPVLEDAPFERQGILMGLYGYAMTAGDLNGDGLTDIAYTGNLTPLTVRFQDEDGGWDEEWTYDNMEPEQWVSTLRVGDIDGDGRMDLGVLARNELLLFFQGKDGRLQEPKRFRLAQGNAHALSFADVNGDKLPDILFASGNNEFRRVSMRLQQAPRELGPEIAFPMRSGSIGLIELGNARPPEFATIDGKTHLVSTFTIRPGGEPPASLDDLQVRDYALGTRVTQAGLYAWGDFNDDSRTDIAVADPAGARVIVFLQTESGDFSEGESYPSFSNISSIATVGAAKGGDRLVVASAREGVAGIAHYTKKGRLSFPDLVRLGGEPLALSSGDYDGDGEADIAAVIKKDKASSLVVASQDREGQWTIVRSVNLSDVKRDPEALLSLRLDADKRDDLIVFAPREPARLMLSTDDGFSEVAVDSAIRRASLNGSDLGRLGVEDLGSDGRSELLVGDNGFVRALALDDAGELDIVDQFNSRSPQAQVRGPFLADVRREGQSQLLLYDDASDRLEMLAADEDGVFRSVEVLDIGQIDLLGARRISLGRKQGDALLFLGQERFWAVPLRNPGWVREEVRPGYETDLEDVNYTDLAAGDFNSDGKPELLTIDGRQNMIEILSEDGAEGYTSALHFVVFESNMHFQGRSSGTLEPREVAVCDLNGDGSDDIAILVHDRVLLYTQLQSALEAPAGGSGPALTQVPETPRTE